MNVHFGRYMIGSAYIGKRIRPAKTIFLLWFVAFFLTFVSAGTGIAGEKVPAPRGAVNDYANVIPQDIKDRMENLSREVLSKTGTAIVVAVVPTIGENDVRDYANSLYRKWGIGEKGKDKGVLIFLALKERRIRIETGYGVEGILPDGLVGEILDKNVIPVFKTGDYGTGLFNAMISVASVIAKDANVTLSGSPPAEVPRAKEEKHKSSLFTIILIVITFIVLMATPQGRDMIPWLLLLIFSGGRGGGGGGGFGDFGGGGFGGFGGGDSGGGGADRDF
jgi:uncharacterized protein